MNFPEQIVLLIFGAAVTGGMATYFTMKLMGYVRPFWIKYDHSESWHKDRYERQERRILEIKHWASEVMKTVPDRCRTMDRQVLVKYENVLDVWDKADRIWVDLGD